MMLKNYYYYSFKVSSNGLHDFVVLFVIHTSSYFMQVLKSKKPKKFYIGGF